ncbi:MAG: C40 family peptidase [Bacteroidales bacterium]|nr:C40 family peptidase [Bacteroidales bacterium]
MKKALIISAIILTVVSCGTARKGSASVAKEDLDPVDTGYTGDAAAAQDTTVKVYEEAVIAQLEKEKEEEGAAMPIEDQIIAYAMEYLGVPYKFGASGPKEFDCSGFTRIVFAKFGYDIPHSSVMQQKVSTPVRSYAELRRGDLVFFGSRTDIRKVGHVGIVVDVVKSGGYFTFIHASFHNGVEVQRSTLPYFLMRYIGAGRLIEEK